MSRNGCVAWTWVDDCGFAHGRLCGSCCGGTGDQTSSTCEGSTSEGKLINITDVDMRARCAANPLSLIHISEPTRPY